MIVEAGELVLLFQEAREQQLWEGAEPIKDQASELELVLGPGQSLRLLLLLLLEPAAAPLQINQTVPAIMAEQLLDWTVRSSMEPAEKEEAQLPMVNFQLAVRHRHEEPMVFRMAQ